MPDTLPISLRPKSLDEMIGAEKMVERIRHRIESNRIPKAWMFIGQTGGGKTTAARIIARALQCTHNKIFGANCSQCWKHRKDYDIDETNASRIRKVEDVEAKVDSYVLHPMPGSKYRIYIFDEAHKLSDHSQNLLLKITEDCPSTTVFIFNTTQEEYIIRTLRRRCRTYVMPSLGLEDIHKLVRAALKKVKSDQDSTELVERLMEKDVTSPGLVLNAVEDYVEGASPEEASELAALSGITKKSLCRQIVKGDWESVSLQLRKMKPEDIYAVQGSVCGYLKGILLEESNYKSGKAKVSVEAILRLSEINATQTDVVKMASLSAIIYDVCRYFRRFNG